jgi:hypothetical protein
MERSRNLCGSSFAPYAEVLKLPLARLLIMQAEEEKSLELISFYIENAHHIKKIFNVI